MNLILVLLAQSLSGFKYKSYNTVIECNSKNSLETPNSLNQLQSLVKDAIKSSTKVKVVGSLYSFTDAICTDGTPISLKNFKNISVDKEAMTATIDTGIELLDALEALNKQGVTIKHVQSFGRLTVGGAIAGGSHGSSLNHPNLLSEYMVGFSYIDSQGELIKMREDDLDFDAFRVSLGLLGIITDVTLKVVPSFKMSIHNQRFDDSKLIQNPNGMIDLARKSDFFQFWWFPRNKGLVISEGKYIGNEVIGNAKTNLVPNTPMFFSGGFKVYYESIQKLNNTIESANLMALEKFTETSLYKYTVGKPGVFTENDIFKNPAVGPAYQLMCGKCTECAWDSSIDENLALLPEEYSAAVPLSRFSEVIADINKILKIYPTYFPLIGLYFRFSPASRGIMSLTNGEEKFNIDFTYPMRANRYEDSPYGLSVMQSIIQMLVLKHGGRPNWGKNGVSLFSHKILSSKYDLAKFKSAIEKYDPKGLFSNKFGNRILGLGYDKYEIPSHVTHCATQNYCLCSKNSDCAGNLKCGSLVGYNVCY
jgi:FAD-dependent oxidoreductase